MLAAFGTTDRSAETVECHHCHQRPEQIDPYRTTNLELLQLVESISMLDIDQMMVEVDPETMYDRSPGLHAPHEKRQEETDLRDHPHGRFVLRGEVSVDGVGS